MWHLEREHDTNLLSLVEVVSDKGLIFNSVKCKIKYPKITFYSTIFSGDGMKLTLRRFKGSQRCHLQICSMLNLMQLYTLNFSLHTASLRELLKKDQAFYWGDNTNAALQKLQTLITKVPCTPCNTPYHYPGRCWQIQPRCLLSLSEEWQTHCLYLNIPDRSGDQVCQYKAGIVSCCICIQALLQLSVQPFLHSRHQPPATWDDFSQES